MVGVVLLLIIHYCRSEANFFFLFGVLIKVIKLEIRRPSSITAYEDLRAKAFPPTAWWEITFSRFGVVQKVKNGEIKSNSKKHTNFRDDASRKDGRSQIKRKKKKRIKRKDIINGRSNTRLWLWHPRTGDNVFKYLFSVFSRNFIIMLYCRVCVLLADPSWVYVQTKKTKRQRF